MTTDEKILPPDLIYIMYIRAGAKRVWDALTQSEFTRQFFFGRTVESDWKQGSRWRLVMADGKTDVDGEVLESDPPRRLKLSWTVQWHHETRDLKPAIITYDLEETGEVTKLIMTQHNEGPTPQKLVEAGKQGWSLILSSLKSLLETGEAIIVEMKLPQ